MSLNIINIIVKTRILINILLMFIFILYILSYKQLWFANFSRKVSPKVRTVGNIRSFKVWRTNTRIQNLRYPRTKIGIQDKKIWQYERENVVYLQMPIFDIESVNPEFGVLKDFTIAASRSHKQKTRISFPRCGRENRDFNLSGFVMAAIHYFGRE